MAPSATEITVPVPEQTSEAQPTKVAPVTSKGRSTLGYDSSILPTEDNLPKLLTDHREPLKLSGSLDKFEQFDVTPVIGREFVNVNLAELLRAPNSDELIKDLAITSESTSPTA
jgi:hypothetical protein